MVSFQSCGSMNEGGVCIASQKSCQNVLEAETVCEGCARGRDHESYIRQAIRQAITQAITQAIRQAIEFGDYS